MAFQLSAGEPNVPSHEPKVHVRIADLFAKVNLLNADPRWSQLSAYSQVRFTFLLILRARVSGFKSISFRPFGLGIVQVLCQ